MGFHTRSVRKAKGALSENLKTRRIVVSFEPAMFERLSGEASRRQLPFATIVREKVLQAYQTAKADS